MNLPFLIANAMCDATRELVSKYLSPDLGSYRVRVRIGEGKATYCKWLELQNTFVLTYGMKMIEDKLDAQKAQSWLSAREIQKYRFYGGKLSPLHLYAHTILHEVAHALHRVRSGRDYGKVHTHHFYQICRELHDSPAAAFVLQVLLERTSPFEIDLATWQTPAPSSEPPSPLPLLPHAPHRLTPFQRGMQVTFSYQRETIQGVILRVNEKTITIRELKTREATAPSGARMWRVPPNLITS